MPGRMHKADSRLWIAAALLLAVSCASQAPRTDLALSPEQARAAEADAVRREAAEGDLRGVRRDGRRFIDRHPGSPEEAPVRLLTGDASFRLGFHEEAAEIVGPLAEAADDSIRNGALRVLIEVDVAKGRFAQAADRLLGLLESRPGEELGAPSRERLSEIVPLLSERDLEAIAVAHPGAPGVDLILLGSLAIVEARGDTAAAGRIRERLGSIEEHAPAPPQASARPADVGVAALRATDAIGLLCPLSGRYATFGEEFIRGARVELREARARGVEGIEL
ncbi:MAG: hypothetical protein PHQ19_06585, partial [Candidatus Krumholzibacteria bacterium]|nr:hypothetical protein [Candidatus Krumholzibacteria bacterium]